MNKTELIAAMAENSGLTKKDCEAALAAFTGAVETAMKSGDGGLWQLRGKGAPCPCGPQPPHRRTHDLPRLQGADLQAWQGTQGCHSVKPHNSKFPRVLPTI